MQLCIKKPAAPGPLTHMKWLKPSSGKLLVSGRNSAGAPSMSTRCFFISHKLFLCQSYPIQGLQGSRTPFPLLQPKRLKEHPACLTAASGFHHARLVMAICGRQRRRTYPVRNFTPVSRTVPNVLRGNTPAHLLSRMVPDSDCMRACTLPCPLRAGCNV